MKVLVAIDFSDVSEPTLEGVKQLLAGDKHEVTLLHVVAPDPAIAGRPIVLDPKREKWHKELKSLQKMGNFLERASVNITPLLLRGPIIQTVLAHADEMKPDIVVVGSHGHGATYDLLVGSVSAAIIRQAKHPVLVIPMPKSR